MGRAEMVSMNVGLYQAVGGLKACEERQHILASNLARATIPGHKQSVAAFESAINASGGPNDKAAGTVGAAQSHQVMMAPPVSNLTQLDFSQGPLESTGDPLQMAIEGTGFFSVREKDGSTSYTRNGSFKWNGDGRITTQDGAQVLGENNTPLSVSTTKGLRIDEAGGVYLDDQSSGKLALAHFKNPAKDLQELSNGRFAKGANVTEAKDVAVADRVRSGYLETSNGNSVEQMVSMIDVMREYEANQKLVIATDDATGKLIKTAGS